MAYIYSRSNDEASEYGMPNVEVFFAVEGEYLCEDERAYKSGWYWWACFPGCLPEGDPSGPFSSEDEARADAYDEVE